eukprot:462748_1
MDENSNSEENSESECNSGSDENTITYYSKKKEKKYRESNLNNLLNNTIYEPWYDAINLKYRQIAKDLYNDKGIKYYDVSLESDSIKDITNNIIETNMKYKTYCEECILNNIKPQSYSICDFIHKNALIYKIKELIVILSNILPTDIIKVIASYSNQIYAKGVRGGNIHFSYHSIIPTKHMYDNLKFRKDNNLEFTQEIGEIIYIFEKYHPNNLYITESEFCNFDVVLYYEKYEIYSIFSVYSDNDCWSSGNDIDLIDFEFHESLLKK